MTVARGLLVLSSCVLLALGCQSLLDVEPDPLRESDAGGLDATTDAALVEDATADAMNPNDAGADAAPEAAARCPMTGVVTPYRRIVLDDDPIAFFAFDSVVASQIRNVCGTDCQLLGGEGATPLVDAGLIGKAPQFSGDVSSYIDCEKQFGFFAGAPFTIEAWIRPTFYQGDSYYGIAGRADVFKGYALFTTQGPGYAGVIFKLGGPDPDAGFTDPGGPIDASFDSGANPVDPGWQHVVAVSDGSFAKLYVNGVVTASEPLPPQHYATDSGATFAIGQGFKGLIDEVAVYDKALPASRILVHYGAPKN